MKHRKRFSIIVALATSSLAISAVPAFAHAEFQEESAKAGSHTELVMGIPHGCGKKNSTKVRIALPDGTTNVMTSVATVGGKVVKGWSSSMTMSGRTQILEFKGPAVAASETKQLLLHFMLSTPKAPGSVLKFPTTQYCGKTVVRWIQPRPADGSDPAESATPVPVLALTK